MRKATQQQEQDTANRAGLDEPDDDDDAQGGYLESLKGKFSFSQVPNKIQFCGCSVKTDQIDDILRFITEYA